MAVFPAVNTQHQDVVIKMVPNEDPELDIFNHLVAEPRRSDPMNLTIPVLEILYYNAQYSFIIMPRYATIQSTFTWF